jgi:hypothetical protein
VLPSNNDNTLNIAIIIMEQREVLVADILFIYLPSKAEAEDESDLIIQQEQLKDLNDPSAILDDLREEQKKYTCNIRNKNKKSLFGLLCGIVLPVPLLVRDSCWGLPQRECNNKTECKWG